MPIGRTNHLGFLAACQARLHHKALGPLGGEGIDRWQLQALIDGAAEPLSGRGGGNFKLLEQNVEAINHQLAGRGLSLEKGGSSGPHLLQGYVGGAQGAGFFEYILEAAGIDGQDARIASNDCITDVAQEPRQVAHGFFHPFGAVATHGNRTEAWGQHDPHVRVSRSAFKEPSEQVAPPSGLGTDKGAHRLLERRLVGGQGFGCAWRDTSGGQC